MVDPALRISTCHSASSSRRLLAADPQIGWPAGPTEVSLADGQVHLWALDLDVTPAALDHYAACLAVDEAQRAARFFFERDRNRFIAGRGWLRTLLAQYLHTTPGRIHFEYGANGKPRLGFRFARTKLEFNLAHSENLALLALTRAQPVGVDVEKVRPLADADDLVAQFFSPRENTAFQQLSPAEKPLAFFNLWTRKEAWLKAIGEGIAHSLSLVEVSFLPQEPARLLAAPSGPFQSRWALRELTPAKGYAAAVALAGAVRGFSCWQSSEPKPFNLAKCH